MPSAIRDLYSTPTISPPRSGITKLTNCLLVRGDQLLQEDIWVSSSTGKILDGQKTFFEHGASPDRTIDLGGRIVSPGLIDVQLNGGFGVDLSIVPEDINTYAKDLHKLNKNLVRTGVTSYCPTIISQHNEVYHKVLPHLRPTNHTLDASAGAESLGAHCEGPFLNPARSGIHKPAILRAPTTGLAAIEACYGAANLLPGTSPIAYITLAPEQPDALSCIRALRARGIRVSIGHSDATFEEAGAALDTGASMVTHLFNAMRPLHHRDPGIFGVLGGGPDVCKKPFFGLIADGVHLHRTSVAIAWAAHPDGAILVTDAMALAGLPDGVYDWTNGERIRKVGSLLTLEGTDGKIAGSSIGLVECVNNFLDWTGASVPQALAAVTSTPARMLGLEGVKGSLEAGVDADLVVFDEVRLDGRRELRVEQVWKFGQMVYDAKDAGKD